jgi:glycerol-3-phosphate acyltransferase PlsY
MSAQSLSMQHWPVLLAPAYAGIGYLLGSIPFGLLLTRVAGLGDIRRIGSGNIGATNVLRTGHRKLAAATLLLDAAKGAVAVLLANWVGGADAGLVAGGGAVLGHMFPVWLRLRGGKGVATGCGVLMAAAWWVALLAGAVWLAVAKATSRSSAGAIAACVAAPILAAFLAPASVAWLATGVAVLIVIRHRENLRRLVAGTEPKIGEKQPGGAA